jgi:hypothetical protein
MRDEVIYSAFPPQHLAPFQGLMLAALRAGAKPVAHVGLIELLFDAGETLDRGRAGFENDGVPKALSSLLSE